MRKPLKSLVVLAAVFTPIIGGVAPASAHVHKAEHAHQGAGQTLGDGAAHGSFQLLPGDTAPSSCDFFALDSPGHRGAYGHEVAHHGPDDNPGRSDGCYTGIPGADGSPGLS